MRQSWSYNIHEVNSHLLRVNREIWRDIDDSIICPAFARGVGVFKYAYRQTLDTMSNYYDSIHIYSAI